MLVLFLIDMFIELISIVSIQIMAKMVFQYNCPLSTLITLVPTNIIQYFLMNESNFMILKDV